jgi:cytochrome c biogenesis protein
MSVSTSGVELSKGSEWMRSVVELLSSMRFAIALLTVICIASVVGTVLLQNEPVNNYVNQFGPFWYEVFAKLNLYNVYSASWFILILAFLVLSTSLCIIRTTPKIMVDLKQFKENIREQSLRAFPHKAQAALHEKTESAARRIGGILVASGWKVRLQRRDTPQGEGWMVAAKTGASNKLGYIAAHSSIVMICIGGLLDGDMMVRSQMWLKDKQVFNGSGLIADVPEGYRLPDTNPTFRGNLMVTEGTTAGVAVLAQPQGVVLQELPFNVELKRFIVEYYHTGMPKLFASEIVIHDRYTGETKEARVEVNKPASHRGIQIYQSSFDDGGSLLRLQAHPMGQEVRPFTVEGRIGEGASLFNGGQKLQLEFAGLKVINVENFLNQNNVSETDVRRVDLRSAIESRLGSGHKTVTEKELRNVGPSFTYRLRDEAGQAVEYHNYMLPIDLDGNRVYVLGVRETPTEDFRYLRVPVDENDGIDGFVRLRSALANPVLRQEAVRRYVNEAAAGQSQTLQEALTVSAQRAINLFAGDDPETDNLPRRNMPVLAGLQAISSFMEVNVPEQERERAAEMLLRILNGTLFELYQISRQHAGLALAPRDEQTANFMTLAVLSLSDSFFYPAPLTFTMTDFDHVQASVFQVARAPGKTIVYIGCLLLTIGIFAMLYVRERRLWVWLSPNEQGGSQASMALSSNRKLLDNDKDFKQLQQRLLNQSSERST